jgi:hypothetical protein
MANFARRAEDLSADLLIKIVAKSDAILKYLE